MAITIAAIKARQIFDSRGNPTVENEAAAGRGGDGEKKPDEKKKPGKKKIDNEKPLKESTVVLKIQCDCGPCIGCKKKLEKIPTNKAGVTVDGATVLVTVKGKMYVEEVELYLKKKLKKTTEVVTPPIKTTAASRRRRKRKLPAEEATPAPVDKGGDKDNSVAASGGRDGAKDENYGCPYPQPENRSEKKPGEKKIDNKKPPKEKEKVKEAAPAPVDKGGENDKAIAAGGSRNGAKIEYYRYPYPQPENYRSSQEQQAQPRPQDAASHSWYPQSVVSPNSSHPSTPGSSYSLQRPTEHPQIPSHVSPGEAAGVIALLKDKSVDELWKLLSDKDAYHQFLLSVDPVKIQNNIRDVLCKENLQLTVELAAAEKKLNELNRQKEELLKFYSSGSLLQKLQEAMNKTQEESKALHRQLLDREIDIVSFVQKYKKLRTIYHQRELVFPWLSHEKPHN